MRNREAMYESAATMLIMNGAGWWVVRGYNTIGIKRISGTHPITLGWWTASNITNFLVVDNMRYTGDLRADHHTLEKWLTLNGERPKA